jgi:rifampicin phosphotransferase
VQTITPTPSGSEDAPPHNERVAAQPSYNNKPLRVTPDDLWTRANAGEVLPGVMTPLNWAYSEDDFDELFGASYKRMGAHQFNEGNFVQLFYGRVYFNFGLMASALTEFGAPTGEFLSNVGGPGAEMEQELFPDQGFRPWRMLKHAPGIFKQWIWIKGLQRRFKKQVTESEARVLELRKVDLDSMSDAELADFSESLEELIVPRLMLLMDAQGNVFTQMAFVRYLLKRWLGDEDLVNDLMTGISGVKTAESNIELWRIARRARSNERARAVIEQSSPDDLLPALEKEPAAATLVAELHDYLRDYGHRAADELEVRNPRWVERPGPLMSAFRGYVLAGDDLDPEEFEKRQLEKRLAAEADVKRRLTGGLAKFFPWRWLVFRATLREAQDYLPLRENPKFYLLKLSLYARYAAVELARRWVASGFLDTEDDVYFLRMEEFREFARLPEGARRARREELKPLIAARRAEWESYNRIDPPMVLRTEELNKPLAELVPEAVEPTLAQLKGIAASKGVATGKARVIIDPSQGGLVAGEILVAPFTDPGWTPFFPLAAAIVMDLGGMLSHGAVVAREYGIPAVVNTRLATKQIKTGQLITVDGLAGTVTIDGA